VSNAAETSPLGLPAGSYLRGCMMVVLAGAIWSVGAFCLRLADGMDPWQYTFWRSLAVIAALWLVASRLDSRSPWQQMSDLRPVGWLAAVAMTLTATMFIAAVKITTLAETFFIASLAPLIAAGFGWLLLGERLSPASCAAIAVGLIGVLVMIEGRLEGGNWAGRALALISACGFAGYALCARRLMAREIHATLLLFGVLAALVGLAVILATGKTVLSAPRDIALAAMHGGVILSVGMLIYSRGAASVPAVTLTVLAQTETVLAPLWGFLFFAEHPPTAVLYGGALILAAVMLQGVLGNRAQSREKDVA
jgi:drug/metabolite transporter (DMT)-like permease